MSTLPLFEEYQEIIELDTKYSTTIKTPVYIPSQRKPFIQELSNSFKSNLLIEDIKQSSVSEEEKSFLIEAAKRHTIFYYSKIADYYAHASPEMQELMERSALVIIDFHSAIEDGYIKLSEEIAEQFIKENYYETD